MTDIERNASLKNEGNPEESFEIVTFAGKPANRLERQEKEVRKKRGMKKSISGRKMPYDDSVGTLVYSASEVLHIGIVIIFI